MEQRRFLTVKELVDSAWKGSADDRRGCAWALLWLGRRLLSGFWVFVLRRVGWRSGLGGSLLQSISLGDVRWWGRNASTAALQSSVVVVIRLLRFFVTTDVPNTLNLGWKSLLTVAKIYVGFRQKLCSTVRHVVGESYGTSIGDIFFFGVLYTMKVYALNLLKLRKWIVFFFFLHNYWWNHKFGYG